MSANLEVIDAFVDGERVDPAVLKDALSEVAGRDFGDFVVWRKDGVRLDNQTSNTLAVAVTTNGPAFIPWKCGAVATP